jgi:LysM repeat protein
MVEKSYREHLNETYTESYTVKDGDTLDRIAMIHGVNARDLAHVNKCLPNTVFPDQVIIKK